MCANKHINYNNYDITIGDMNPGPPLISEK